MTNMHGKESIITEAKNTAIREVELMHQAILNRQLKEALLHQNLANAALDEMMLDNKMVEEKSKK